jgi:hypothetical protein
MPARPIVHPAGEPSAASFPHPVETPGGVIHAVWDQGERVTPSGPLIYFVQFLQASGLWSFALQTCPLSYTSPNAPRIAEVLGTLLLTVLHGGRRYLHASGIRYDPVIGEALGMRKILSHESLRRAIARDGRDRMQAWLQQQLLHAVRPALRRAWILDEDVTSRVVCGTQEGAVVGYNGKKPGHPSLALHTYVVAHLRLVLDVHVKPGNETSGAHGHDGLIALVSSLPADERPSLVRGDIAYGFDTHMSALEQLSIRYLFKVRRSDGVKEMIAEAAARSDWIEAGKGWQGIETQLHLMSWARPRRAIILRRPETQRPAIKLGRRTLNERAVAGAEQLTFIAPPPSTDGFEYAVLITSLDLPVAQVAQLYRDRADAENVNDELKNHWGWGGFTTDELDRTAIMARFTALIYNWWTMYCRSIMPRKHMEAVTARPLLMHGVGQLHQHGGQRELRITGVARGCQYIACSLTDSARRLSAWARTVAQLAAPDRWYRLADEVLKAVEAALESLGPFSTRPRVT